MDEVLLDICENVILHSSNTQTKSQASKPSIRLV